MQNGSTEMATKRYKERESDTGIHAKTPHVNDAISNGYVEQNARCKEYIASKNQSVESLAMPPPAAVKDLVPCASRLEPDCRKRENDNQRRSKLNRDKKFKRNHSSVHALNSDNTSLNNVQPTIPVSISNSVCKESTPSGYDDDRRLSNIITGLNNTVALVQDSERDTINVSNDYGDLKKLDMMTAADFDRDRYARFGIHESEVKDYVRTMAYKNCIESCSEKYMKDKVILVVRSGIGLLPMLCVRSGLAKRVIALEESACIEYARRIVNDNNYIHKITLIQTSVHDLKSLPHGLSQVDVILSDFMGECVLNQGIEMEQVIIARNRFLKPNGLMIPMRVTLYGQLLEQRKAFENQRVCRSKKTVELVDKESVIKDHDDADLSWWGDVYGFDMRSKHSFLINSSESDCNDVEKDGFLILEPINTYFNPKKVVSAPCVMKEFDMKTCTIADARNVHCKDLIFKCVVRNVKGSGGEYGHMIELFMKVDFPCEQLNNNGFIGFSTSSVSPSTRYRQTGLLLRDQLLITDGDEFVINDFYMWRGPQNQEDTLYETISNGPLKKFNYSENLKLRLQYTFVNKYMSALNRRCAYILERGLF